MGNKTEFVIKDRAITAGGMVHEKGRIVTAEIMKLNENEWAGLVKKGLVTRRPIVEVSAPPSGGGNSPAVLGAKSSVWERIKNAWTGDTPPTRIELISAYIATLYDADGKQLNPDNFIATGEPGVDALEALMKDVVPGFADGLTMDERSEGYKHYLDSIKALQ